MNRTYPSYPSCPRCLVFKFCPEKILFLCVLLTKKYIGKSVRIYIRGSFLRDVSASRIFIFGACIHGRLFWFRF